MRELLIKWLREGLALQSGEEIYIPADNKTNQGDLYNMLRRELSILRNIDAEGAAKLRISTTFKDGAFWVVLKKISVTPLIAFKKNNDGEVSRITITNTSEQDRITKLKNKGAM
jgi:hypothetical protein